MTPSMAASSTPALAAQERPPRMILPGSYSFPGACRRPVRHFVALVAVVIVVSGLAHDAVVDEEGCSC